MCGIVGYIGPRQAAGLLLEGLRRLEYRGYDSSGIAVVNGQGGLVEEVNLRTIVLRDLALAYRGDIGITPLVSQAHALPANVRFIITSRPIPEIERKLEAQSTAYLHSVTERVGKELPDHVHADPVRTRPIAGRAMCKASARCAPASSPFSSLAE